MSDPDGDQPPKQPGRATGDRIETERDFNATARQVTRRDRGDIMSDPDGDKPTKETDRDNQQPTNWIDADLAKQVAEEKKIQARLEAGKINGHEAYQERQKHSIDLAAVADAIAKERAAQPDGSEPSSGPRSQRVENSPVAHGGDLAENRAQQLSTAEAAPAQTPHAKALAEFHKEIDKTPEQNQERRAQAREELNKELKQPGRATGERIETERDFNNTARQVTRRDRGDM